MGKALANSARGRWGAPPSDAPSSPFLPSDTAQLLVTSNRLQASARPGLFDDLAGSIRTISRLRGKTSASRGRKKALSPRKPTHEPIPARFLQAPLRIYLSRRVAFPTGTLRYRRLEPGEPPATSESVPTYGYTPTARLATPISRARIRYDLRLLPRRAEPHRKGEVGIGTRTEAWLQPAGSVSARGTGS